jgi:hypothetical protein
MTGHENWMLESKLNLYQYVQFVCCCWAAGKIMDVRLSASLLTLAKYVLFALERSLFCVTHWFEAKKHRCMQLCLESLCLNYGF